MKNDFPHHTRHAQGPGKTLIERAERRCHRCYGSGRSPCQICGGSGEVIKGKDVHGRITHDRCDGCFGNKTTRCAICNGKGMA